MTFTAKQNKVLRVSTYTECKSLPAVNALACHFIWLTCSCVLTLDHNTRPHREDQRIWVTLDKTRWPDESVSQLGFSQTHSTGRGSEENSTFVGHNKVNRENKKDNKKEWFVRQFDIISNSRPLQLWRQIVAFAKQAQSWSYRMQEVTDSCFFFFRVSW